MTTFSRITSLGLIVAAGLVTAVSAPAAGCRIYSARVFWHGVGGSVAINTPIYACISNAEGSCNAKGGYLYLKNNSSDQSVRWASTAAGQGTLVPIDPGQSRIVLMPVYRTANQELTADLQVEVCQ